jgi:hypothetical protein
MVKWNKDILWYDIYGEDILTMLNIHIVNDYFLSL